MFSSLKIQVSLFITLFVVLLASQYLISQQTQKAFLIGLTRSQSTIERVNLVKELERDLIDLQRVVLIYKQTASPSILTRFDGIFSSITNNLDTVEELLEQDKYTDQYGELLERMRGHLNDYRDNFSMVVRGRESRKALIEDNISVVLLQISEQLAELEQSQKETNVAIYATMHFHAMNAQTSFLRFLLNSDPANMNKAQQQLEQLRTLIINSSPQKMPKVLAQIGSLNRQLIDLTQISRGYLYLVNVVMTGSANEFLYLAKELNSLMSQRQSQINQSILKSSQQAQTNSELFSIAGIVLAFIAAFFFIYRVVLPINAVTELFNRLVKGESVGKLASARRKDEVGELIDAARIFSLKNKELEEQKHKAEQATRHKSIFLANMSHEIRTPMNGIIGLIDIVLQTKLTKEQTRLLQKVDYSSKILLSIINDILDFSKIEAGKLQLENIEFSIHSLFENLLAICSVKAREKNLNIHFYANPQIPSLLIGDPVRITQILLNLSTNAIKFTRNGTIYIGVEVQSQQNQQITLQVVVRDTGIGMSEEQIQVVFDAFKQADDSTNRKFGGTGLGLSIVKQLSEMMGGKITVESKVNEGSTFSVTLPLASRGTEQLFPQHPITSCPAIVYVSNETPLVSSKYLALYSDKVMQVTQKQFSSMLDDLNSDTRVCFDIYDQPSYKRQQEFIQKAKEKDITFGLFTNSQPENLPILLRQKWQCPVLEHPFTPQQFDQFMCTLVGIKTDKKLSPAAQDDQAPPRFSGHVLIVEDNNINQLVVSEMLNNFGLTYDIAEDGSQAVTKIRNSDHYDLVLMDIQMPVMDGYQATKILRQSGYSDMIICGLSANAMKSDFEQAAKAGMNEYLTKPIRQAALLKILKKYFTALNE